MTDTQLDRIARDLIRAHNLADCRCETREELIFLHAAIGAALEKEAA